MLGRISAMTISYHNIMITLVADMLSFRNAKTVDLYVNRASQKIGLLYVNRKVSEKRAFMRELFFLTINVNNIHCISKKDYILVINTLTRICIITNSSSVIIQIINNTNTNNKKSLLIL